MNDNIGTPEISVIVPVYKVEWFLPECIDSILAQTFSDFELILVDDGSPDGCPAICDGAAVRDSRVRVIHKPNGGVSTARNAGLDIARGNWIGFVDADDVIDRTYYEKLHRAATQAGAEIAAAGILGIEADGTPCRHQEYLLRNEVLSQQEAIHRMRLTPLLQMATKLQRRDLFEGIRFPVGKNYEDAAVTPALFEKMTFVACVAEPLYHYRMNPEGIMRGKVSLKNLYEVDVNYGLFQCLLKHGKTDVLFVQYAMMRRVLNDTRRRLPREDRNSLPVRQAADCVKKAAQQMKQCGAVTPRAVLEGALFLMNPQFYFDFKYGKNRKGKST